MPKSVCKILVVMTICFAVGFLASCAGSPDKVKTGSPAANLVVTPNSGLAQSKIAIRGSGFMPGEKIEVVMVIEGVTTELGEEPVVKEANEAGAFRTLSFIPMTAQPGLYTVKAVGDRGTVALAPLEVEPKPEKKK